MITNPPPATEPATQREPTALADVQLFRQVRARSMRLAAPLSAEDQCIQSMPDASPTKWHLAHTTWFFEAVLLCPSLPGYLPFQPRWHYLFNSYYESLGPRHPRGQRGVLTRPTLAEVLDWRMWVDAAIERLFDELRGDTSPTAYQAALELLRLGIHHEQQHQELLLTDILHAFSCNPLLPAYQHEGGPVATATSGAASFRWLAHPGGVVAIGHAGDGFAFDNEEPRHPVLLRPFAMANRLVTCGDYAQFIEQGGYREPRWWLSEGWRLVQAEGWTHPVYWLPSTDPRLAGVSAAQSPDWHVFGLDGVRPMDADAPVVHLSYFEAAAYAGWAGARLPTEFEWEAAVMLEGVEQVANCVWQWTSSAYGPYPGFRPCDGVAAEYNGKFMVGQMVLRGGSLATPEGHARHSYRNFFPPAARWQFSGFRLAKDL